MICFKKYCPVNNFKVHENEKEDSDSSINFMTALSALQSTGIKKRNKWMSAEDKDCIQLLKFYLFRYSVINIYSTWVILLFPCQCHNFDLFQLIFS